MQDQGTTAGRQNGDTGGGRWERWGLFGALIAAAIASACCTLPLLLVALGLSGAALSGFFEEYRPVFLGITFALLAAMFYFVYRPHRQPTADNTSPVPAEGQTQESCCPPASKARRLSRIALWMVTLMVLALAFFPYYAGALLGGGRADNQMAANADLAMMVVRVDGMTCEGCAAGLKRSLKAVPGVAAAEVDYAKGQAIVGFRKDQPVSEENMLEAIANQGYKGHIP